MARTFCFTILMLLAALTACPAHGAETVLLGIDVIQRDGPGAIAGRVGLITNHTGVDRTGRATVDVLNEMGGGFSDVR